MRENFYSGKAASRRGQEEIREGKSLSGEGELFSFLENYSS